MQIVMILFSIIVFFISPFALNAYVGPGLGLGAIGAILGIILSIILAILGIFWYPIKRFMKKIRGKNKNDTTDG